MAWQAMTEVGRSYTRVQLRGRACDLLGETRVGIARMARMSRVELVEMERTATWRWALYAGGWAQIAMDAARGRKMRAVAVKLRMRKC